MECDGSTVLSKLVGGKNAPVVGRAFALSGGDGKKIRDSRLQPSPCDSSSSSSSECSVDQAEHVAAQNLWQPAHN